MSGGWHVTEVPGYGSAGRRTDLPVAEGELDADLRRTVRHTSYMRQGFYVVVLLVALAGQVSGAVEALHIPLVWAVPAVGALELGGIVVLANADVRRRLGERAVASRVLSAMIAVGAVAFNWLAHANHLLGGFFAGMSALGYLVWLMHTENQRRDRLRAKGDLPPTTPAYEVLGHWLRHPWLTLRAKTLAKANAHLDLYDSLAAARAEVRRERRQAAISKVLHRKIRSAVDPTTADIALAVYDLDEIATRLADNADYAGLTALIAADLAPERLAVSPAPRGRRGRSAIPTTPLPAQLAPAPELTPGPAPTPEPASAPELTQGPGPVPGTDLVPVGERRAPARPAPELGERPAEPAEPRAAALPADLRRDIRRDFETIMSGTRSSGTDRPPPREIEPAEQPALVAAAEQPLLVTAAEPVQESLRRRVHATLDAKVPAGDDRDHAELVELVTEELALKEEDRLAIPPYVQSWTRDRDGEHRTLASAARHVQPSLPTQPPGRATSRTRQSQRPPSTRTRT
jgi:hypothetical protein